MDGKTQDGFAVKVYWLGLADGSVVWNVSSSDCGAEPQIYECPTREDACALAQELCGAIESYTNSRARWFETGAPVKVRAA